jgi:hypothetical protein
MDRDCQDRKTESIAERQKHCSDEMLHLFFFILSLLSIPVDSSSGLRGYDLASYFTGGHVEHSLH